MIKDTKSRHILVTDDEDLVRKLLKELLEPAGYKVTLAKSGRETLQKLQEEIPHLLILDLAMPDMNGHETYQQIRKNIFFRHLPIMMLTGRGTFEDKISSLKQGCDEYLEKPFIPEELIVRVEAIIRRNCFRLDANPLTHLPGNNSIYEELTKRIKTNEPFALCYLDIDNFKSFNDIYGFNQGDEAIKLTACIIFEAIAELNLKDVFIGHLGGDDFVLIINPEVIDLVLTRILRSFDAKTPLLYSGEDRKRGFIITTNRCGRKESFPMISLSGGVVTNIEKNFTHYAEIVKIGAEIKQYAKSLHGSIYVIDRRRKEKELLPIET